MNLKISREYLESILNIYDNLFNNLNIEKYSKTDFVYEINISASDLKYYISSSTFVLKNMLNQAFETQKRNIIYSTLEVFNYLVYPKDILPDNEYYLLGYFDDAWLIHNYVNCSFEDYTFNLDDIDIDWHKINRLNTAVSNNYQPEKYKRLNQKMKRVLHLSKSNSITMN